MLWGQKLVKRELGLSFSRRLFSTEPPKKIKWNYLYGLNAVQASLTANRRIFSKLYLPLQEKDSSPKSNPRIEAIFRKATQFGVKTKYVSKTKLTNLSGAKPHQNVVLKASRTDYLAIRKIEDVEGLRNGEPLAPNQGRFYLLLDGITDPQNFGSILRSALFLGVDAIVVSKQEACGLTPAVSKVSSGALELTPLFQVKFVRPFLEDAAKNYHFNIISTNIDDKSES